MPSAKRNCYGCRALKYVVLKSRKVKVGCVLRYAQGLVDKTPLLPEPTPIEKRCPKPRTHAALSELLKGVKRELK
jgi:hypothetical protein